MKLPAGRSVFQNHTKVAVNTISSLFQGRMYAEMSQKQPSMETSNCVANDQSGDAGEDPGELSKTIITPQKDNRDLIALVLLRLARHVDAMQKRVKRIKYYLTEAEICRIL
jgi:hypothetical protein